MPFLLAEEASGAAAHAAVSTGTTAFFGALLFLMVLCLALEEKIHAKKSVITGVAALVTLFLGAAFGVLPHGPATLAGHELHMPLYIAAIDWEVIAIILGASLFVDVTSKSGMFSWVAIKLTKASGGDPLKLLVAYGVLTCLFSAFLNNVTAMIIVGSLTAVSLGRLGQQEKLLGFLLIEGLMTNVGGLLTLISSVPNIIVGSKAGISFMEFFLVAAPYVVVATAVTLWMGKKMFKIEGFATDEERAAAQAQVEGFDENDGIESKRFFWICVAAFALFVVCLAAQSVLPVVGGEHGLGLGFVALAFAGLMLVAYKHEVNKFYAAVDWDLLGFFATLFVVIWVMEQALVLVTMGGGVKWMLQNTGASAGPVALTWAAAGLSAVTDNIPLSAVLAKILPDAVDGIHKWSPEWWSVIFGANLGGNITPIGSASTVVAVTIMHKHKVPMSFLGFVKTAMPFALVQLVLASGYVIALKLVLPEAGS